MSITPICSYGQVKREVYVNYEIGIAVDLENSSFKVTASESWPNSDMVIGHELKKGVVTNLSDTIKMTTTEGQKIVLVRESEEVLKSVMFDLIPNGQKLYAGTKFYPSGKVREQGSWDKGKKSGLWMYWNEAGEVINKRIYKRGKIKKGNYKFRWEK